MTTLLQIQGRKVLFGRLVWSNRVLEDLRRALETIVGRDVHVVYERGLRRLRDRIRREAVRL